MEAVPSSPGLSPCRVVVLDKVTDLLLLFGKLLVVGGVGKDQARAASTGQGAGKWRAGSQGDADLPQGSCPSFSSPVASWGWAKTLRAAPSTITGCPSW